MKIQIHKRKELCMVDRLSPAYGIIPADGDRSKIIWKSLARDPKEIDTFMSKWFARQREFSENLKRR